MFSFILMMLDTAVILLSLLFLYRFLRVIVMRVIFMHRLRSVCRTRNFRLTVHRRLFPSLFCRSSKADLTVGTENCVYYLKFLASFSSKQVFQFVDENNYVSYVKTFTALPMATKISEHTQMTAFHRLPTLERKNAEGKEGIYVLLFNPTPNNILSIIEGKLIEIGNGSPIGSLRAYNGRGFCAMLEQAHEGEG